MELKATVSEIPKKIKLAANLIYLSLFVGFIKSVSYETLTNQKMLSDPQALTVGIVTIILIGLLAYAIGQGKNWSRITLLILFILGMLGYPLLVLNEFQTNPIIGIVSIVQMGIQLYALIILFSGESKEWFKDQKLKSTLIHE
jgi:hypothetical protein